MKAHRRKLQPPAKSGKRGGWGEAAAAFILNKLKFSSYSGFTSWFCPWTVESQGSCSRSILASGQISCQASETFGESWPCLQSLTKNVPWLSTGGREFKTNLTTSHTGSVSVASGGFGLCTHHYCHHHHHPRSRRELPGPRVSARRSQGRAPPAAHFPVGQEELVADKGQVCESLKQSESFFWGGGLFGATLVAHGSSQARGQIGAAAAGLHHSHSQ